VMLNWAMV